MARPLVLLLLLLLVSAATLAAAADNATESKCLCQATSCLCCVELNLTSSIDLGGPACVNVRHLERNVSLNLSYGDNPVHNATIALDKAARRPTCMNLLSDLAQICAEFVSMKQQQTDSYDGCLVIEPALLGAPQATYPVGCFKFEKGLVRQIEGQVIPAEDPAHKPEDPEEEDEEDTGLNAEELIAAVSASAEQGIALFSQWLGINLGPRVNVTTSHKEPEQTTSAAAAAAAAAAATASQTNARHGRIIAMLTENEDKSDERFKQLLSAQDNIHRESAKIDEDKRGLKTAFLYSQPSAEEVHQPRPQQPVAIISPENLAVVPSESRRGGRAYNIHQHVNEV